MATIKNRAFWLGICFVLLHQGVFAQMFVANDTLYGNEWIDYTRIYYKIQVPEDGIYRIDYQALSNAGISTASITGNQWRLFRNGQQVPIFTSSNGNFGSSDFIEFWGTKNRIELDSHLFDNPAADLVNPWYSMFNDTAAYFLTWQDGGSALRIQTVANDLNNLPAPEPYCWKVNSVAFNNTHIKRRIETQVSFSWFNGDGFSNTELTTTGLTIGDPQTLNTGPAAQVRLRYSAGLGAHRQQVFLHDSLYADDTVYDWKVWDKTFTVSANRLYLGLKVEIKGLESPTDRNSLAGYEIRFPRTFNFENTPSIAFSVPASGSNKFLAMTAPGMVGTEPPVLYDLSNLQRIVSDVQGNTVRVGLGSSNLERNLVLAGQATGIRRVLSLAPVQFRDYGADKSSNYIILSNRVLFSDPDDGGKNQVAEYADYRRSAAGGNYKVSVVDIKELYDQFGYGVTLSPLAVRNFAHFIKKTWVNPEYLLIIGKGLNYSETRSSAIQKMMVDSVYLVPMYGTPAVDQSFLMPRGGVDEPIMAVGRIAVTTPKQIKEYLTKVIEQEAEQALPDQNIDAKAWMKRVIHISGGQPGDAAILRAYSNNMANVLQNNRFGADITTIYKTSNDPIQTSAIGKLRSLVKDGASLWMIYGHSTYNQVDFDIGPAALYENQRRYPYMLTMGCFSGVCSVPLRSLGEEYVLSPKSGAIAYTASVSYSFIDALYTNGNGFYNLVGGEDYGKTIGQITQHNIKNLHSTAYTHLIAVLHQNVLQGDPALRLQTTPGPDYVVDPQSVVFNPNPVPIDQPTYSVGLDVANIGENVTGKVAVKISEQQLDNTLRVLVYDTITAPALRTRLNYDIPTEGSKIGFNRIHITVDDANQIEEKPLAAETNNDLLDATGSKGVEVYFYSNDIQPVFPANYAIVSKDNITLSASTLSSSSGTARYLFEFDTIETFNSPFKQNYEVQQKGGLLQWKPNVVWKDSTVYYWRVTLDSLVNGTIPWKTASFIYIKNAPTGWNQSDFGQYSMNTLSNLIPQDPTRSLEFASNTNNLLVKLGYLGLSLRTGLNNSFYEGKDGDYQWIISGVYAKGGGVCLMIHDPGTGRVIMNPTTGPHNPNPTIPRHFFYFNTADSLERIALMEFIKNDIPTNSTVGLMAFNFLGAPVGYDPKSWAKDSITYGKNLFQVLEEQGAKKVRSLADYNLPVPYGLIFRKDDPTFAVVDTTVSDPLILVEIRQDYTSRWFSGQMAASKIGPAKQWGRLQFKPGPKDDVSDESNLHLYGLRPDGITDTLLMTLQSAADTSIAMFSSTTFPYMRLEYQVLDTTANRTPTPLEYARVLYATTPEGALNPTAYYKFEKDTLDQGEPLKASIAFANISDAAFDTLLVRFRIENQASSVVVDKYYPPLAVEDTLHAALQLSTKGLSGLQRLTIDVNPDKDQPEIHHFNNVAFQPFFVKRDNRNPLLDVTFDGEHLLDGDLISPKPQVTITLKDDNRYLAISDTGLFALKLVYPNGTVQDLYLNDPDILFFPADANNLPQKNKAKIEWRPTFTVDGDYQLQVNGRDASGNESAALDYTINFKVITKSSLSNLLNYPNPFSTNTCFVYTMTGAETPVAFKLQIMTVSGKIVREVLANEFGPLQAGTHQSNFCWDGKDEYGDQLANGVYLYRIVARKADGTPFEFFDNSAVDGYFKGGFGKMVLIR